jgi:hypothetical protein
LQNEELSAIHQPPMMVLLGHQLNPLTAQQNSENPAQQVELQSHSLLAHEQICP